MDSQLIAGLMTDAQTSLDAFQSTGTEKARNEAHDKALRLARALEKPRDAILKLSFSPTVIMAVKVAHDLNIFTVLAEATSPVPLAKLAAAGKQADPLLVERLLRLLVANGIVEEPAPCEYLPNGISKEMTQRTSVGVVESMFLEVLPLIQRTPEYLQATNYRNPDDPTAGPLQYTHKTKSDSFTWLCENPAAMARFNTFMEGQRANRPYWGDWFPVRERILNETSTDPERPLLVDIGGGRGHDLLAFKDRFPDAPGKLVLEDLPGVIDEVRGIQNLSKDFRFDTVPYDFFTQVQPVQGSRMYYFKHVLHDWSDEKATIMFNNLKPAMQRGYSKLLIEEYILPDHNASQISCLTDIGVMVFCSGLERTRQQWTRLLTSVGFRILEFWLQSSGLGVIEVDLPVEQDSHA